MSKEINTKMNVQFTKASTLENIQTKENISTSFGKLSKWYDSLLPVKTLTREQLASTAGNFVFGGSNLWTGSDGWDWVGIQFDVGYEKFQIMGFGNTVLIRGNDTGGTDSSDWTGWFPAMTCEKILPGTGISTVEGDNKTNVTINHSNSITALTTTSLRKIKYDACGHITGSSAVSLSDLPTIYTPIVASNEIRFDSTTKPSSETPLLINYYWSNGASDAKITSFNFYDGGGSLTGIRAATISSRLKQMSSSRLTSANVTSGQNTSVEMFLATNSMSTGKPESDGYILSFQWDTSAAYQSQLFIPAYNNGSVDTMEYRIQGSNSSWSTASSWFRVPAYIRLVAPNAVDPSASGIVTGNLSISSTSITGIYRKLKIWLCAGTVNTMVSIDIPLTSSGASRPVYFFTPKGAKLINLASDGKNLTLANVTNGDTTTQFTVYCVEAYK